MPKLLDEPDCPTQRRWRTVHPFRPRLSTRRRTCMMVIFIFLSAIIGGYEYITDSTRVREISERHNGIPIEITPPLDGHPALLEVMLERARGALG